MGIFLYRAHGLHVGDVLSNRRNLKRLVTGRLPDVVQNDCNESNTAVKYLVGIGRLLNS